MKRVYRLVQPELEQQLPEVFIQLLENAVLSALLESKKIDLYQYEACSQKLELSQSREKVCAKLPDFDRAEDLYDL